MFFSSHLRPAVASGGRGHGGVKLSEETIRNRLRDWPVARLATLAPDGRPTQVPIVFAQMGDRLWSPVDGKPKSGGELARVRNLRQRPRVSLLLDDYDEDWQRLWWIALDAQGEVVQPEAPERDETFQAALEALRGKYPQYANVPLLGEPPTLLAFRPQRIRSWCAK